MNARLEAIRQRETAEVLELCAEQQENLDAAKAAYEEDPGPESRAAKREAMEEMHRVRAWLREGARPVLPPGEAQPARLKARVKRGGA